MRHPERCFRPSLRLGFLVLLTLALALPGAAGAKSASRHGSAKHSPKRRKQTPSILRSPLLWATTDLCSPSDRPNTIGVRGSMPGDGQGGELMYMRFRVQYQDASSGRFLYVAAADSQYVLVGSARTRFRQAGRNFEFQISLQPPPYRPRYVLRGWVDFQWRLRHKVVRSASVATTAPHSTGAAGDPSGYSAATCTLD